MKINFAHLRESSSTGGYINFAVFEARSSSGTKHDNSELLAQLTYEAKRAGYKVEKSALAYEKFGQIEFFGTKDLVEYLSNTGLPPWTHYLVV